MSVLHLIQQPISRQNLATQLERFYRHGDTVLFINDAVFSLAALSKDNTLWQQFGLVGQLFTLHEHVEARGLLKLLDLKRIKCIDYQAFVELTVKAPKTISW